MSAFLLSKRQSLVDERVQQFPVRTLLLPGHQDVKIGGVFLAIGDRFALAQPMEPHDRDIADHTDRGLLVFQRQELRFSGGGVLDECRLVLDAAVGMAVAQFRRAEPVERLRVGGELGGSKRFEALRHGLLVSRKSLRCSGSQQTKRDQAENRQRPGQMTTTDVHVVSSACFELSPCSPCSCDRASASTPRNAMHRSACRRSGGICSGTRPSP